MNWTDLNSLQKTDQAEHLIAKGYTYSQAAKALGTTRSAVAGALDRGIMRTSAPRPPRQRTTPENRQPSQAGKTAMQRGSTAIAQEKARRARAKALSQTAEPDATEEATTGRRLLAAEIWQPLPGSTPVPLDQRTGCAWPIGHGHPFLFCNEPVAAGHSWCPTHFAAGNRPVVVGTPKRVAPKPLKGLTS
jgi:hypothetical protein